MSAAAAFQAKSKAEAQLVAALTKGRAIKRTIGRKADEEAEERKSVDSKSDDETSRSKSTVHGISVIPPRPPILSQHQQEVAEVRVLDIPSYDSTRTFPGLSKQKITKKDRHVKAIDEFTRMIDTVAEGIEQDVLNISRAMREDLERLDASLAESYDLLKSPPFLIPRSEVDLKDMLITLKHTVAERLQIVNKFGEELDGLEIKRVDIVGTELKLLVDRLISIAHQLPDEIEHIVESNIFDLNSVLTTNRKAHAGLLGMLLKAQVEVDVDTMQRWEDGRSYWRQLRHDKGLSDFDVDISSDRFERPTDRAQYMVSVQDGQKQRQAERDEQLQALGRLTSDDITVEKVQKFQSDTNHIGDVEVEIVNKVFERLGELRGNLKLTAEERVEELRKELHVYGALHDEPPFLCIADVMRDALSEETLSDLWRLGGGLKQDFQSLSTDMCCSDLAYDPFVISIQDRLTQICCGLGVRQVLEDRGRLMQLDKARNFVGKLRGVSKFEVPTVLEGLMPELEDFVSYEQVTDAFRDCIKGCLAEMEADLVRIKLTPMVPDTSALSGTAKSKNGTTRGATGKGSKSQRGPPDVPNFIDPVLVKQWNRKLAILFYSCDLPENVQEMCQRGLIFTAQQLECNSKIDMVVITQSHLVLDVMDKKYKRLNEDVMNYLEAQANFMAICLTNLGTFYLDIAKLVEAHRKNQKVLDETSADALYDLSEDMRIQKEDAEVVFESACDVLRASTTHDELHTNFESVLEILEKIQDSYRTYHGKACFQADKYPLSLSDEFRTYLINVASKFNMHPMADHALMVRYEEIFDETIRFNRKFFEEDPRAGGVEPRLKDLHPPMEASIPGSSVGGSRPGSVAGGGGGSGTRPGSPGGSVVAGGSIVPDIEVGEIYESPLMVQAIQAAKKAAKRNKGKKEDPSLEKITALPPPSSLSGAFRLNQSLEDTVNRLREEADDEPLNAEAEVEATIPADAEGAPEPVETRKVNMSHPECPWIRKDAIILPVSEEVELAMDEYVLRDYEKCIANRFIAMNDEAIAELTEEDQARYYRTQIVRDRAKERLAIEEDPVYIRNNVPCDLDNNPWVLKFEIETAIMQNLVIGIRDSLITSVEIETERRLNRAQDMKKDYKDEFTEELEDRLRTHWPRRGRVETGIKQPRESELLGHEEKTWRLIQNIQERMINVQRRFEAELEAGKARCTTYVNEVGGLQTHITTEKFRNLAKLQGVEVKARSLYITFQAAGVKQMSDVRRLLDEVPNIIAYAMDFRKICPPQEPGVEGGYSPAEILEIEALMISQCNDARSIVEEWTTEMNELGRLQDTSSLVQGEFTKKYEKVAQDLAMSEGLGQKYGAPRRRAQERIRTEVSRDESNAGKIDEMLAKLEFDVAEAIRLEEHPETVIFALDEDTIPDPVADNGFRQTEKSTGIWTMMNALRNACQARVNYLQVCELELNTTELAWPPIRIEKISEIPDELKDDDEDDGVNVTATITTINKVMVEVDENCRKETRELYESEGLGSVLGDGGVPESLATWLEEAKQKILGSGGHREKAWKRLWGQVARYEKLVGRKVALSDNEKKDEDEDEDIENKEMTTLGIPGVCVRLNVEASLRFLKYSRDQEQVKFMKLVTVLEKVREKHERLLRPCLGSPDAVDDLADLDRKENERSAELISNILEFRAELVSKLADASKKFCEDLCLSSKSLVQYIDSSMRLEALQLPPDTAIPKKRMTLKRLRKAQRLRNNIAGGAEDRSKERDWDPVNLKPLMETLKSAEDMVEGHVSAAPEPVVEAAPAAKGGKATKGAPAAVAEPPKEKSGILLSAAWMETTSQDSIVHGSVTTAHRSLVTERDKSLLAYIASLEDILHSVREKFGLLLRQEESWNKQWHNQVDMLRNGKL